MRKLPGRRRIGVAAAAVRSRLSLLVNFRELARFGAAGAVQNGLSYALYLLLNIVTPYWIAFSVAYAAGVAQSFVFNGLFVFRDTSRFRPGAFALFHLAAYGLSLLLLDVMVRLLGFPEWLAPLIILPVAAGVNFFSARRVLTGRFLPGRAGGADGRGTDPE